MAQVKKISVAKVFGKITAALLMVADAAGKVVPRAEPVHVMRVGGLATGTKEGVSDYGTYKALVGEFVAYSAKDGEEHRAPYCFLPDVALVPLTVALSQNPGAGVQFMIDVFVKHDAESSVGYVYTFETVVKPKGEDPIAALLALAPPMKAGDKMVGGTLPLPAPETPETPATPADTKKRK